MELRSSFCVVVIISLVLMGIEIMIRTDFTINPAFISNLRDRVTIWRVPVKNTDLTRAKSTERVQDVNKTERERCDLLLHLKDEQVFQHVDNNNYGYVYSAIWDSVDKGEQEIRMVGMVDGRKQTWSMPYCYIRDAKTKSCIRIEAKTVRNPYTRRLGMSGRLFNCPLPPGVVPEGVSLMTTENGPLHNRMPVMNCEGKQGLQYNFTMCVSPIHSGYNDIRQLITFIELSTILGADYFVFYNTSMSKSVEQIVLKLTEGGSAMVIQWQLPEEPVVYYGQVPMLNDCMNRMIYRTRYICETDLDEFIIPRKYKKWQDLIDKKQKVFPRAGAFIAKADYYLSESANHSFKYPGRDAAEMYDVLPLLNLVKMTDIPRTLRLRKYIYDPRKVKHVWVHRPGPLRKPWIVVRFRKDEAMFHHYRKVFKNERKLKKPKTFKTDTTILRFTDDLLRRIEDRVLKNRNTLR